MIDLDSTEGYSGQTQASTLTSPTLRKTSLRWNPLGGSGVGWGGVCTNLKYWEACGVQLRLGCESRYLEYFEGSNPSLPTSAVLWGTQISASGLTVTQVIAGSMPAPTAKCGFSWVTQWQSDKPLTCRSGVRSSPQEPYLLDKPLVFIQ